MRNTDQHNNSKHWLQHFIQKEKLIYSGKIHLNSVFYIVTILQRYSD